MGDQVRRFSHCSQLLSPHILLLGSRESAEGAPKEHHQQSERRQEQSEAKEQAQAESRARAVKQGGFFRG